jgi:hypothetical protein
MAELGLAIAPIAFKALVATWNVLDDALNFSQDSEDLLIRLETARAHFGIWASLSGLEKGELAPDLLPLDELISRALKRITGLLSDADELRKSYGIAIEDKSDGNPTNQTTKISELRRFLQSVSFRTKPQVESVATRSTSKQSIPKRLSWGIYDKQKFDKFVSLIETHVTGLHKLLPDQQRKKAQQEETRFGLRVVQGLGNKESLLTLVDAAGLGESLFGIDISDLAKWKTITLRPKVSSGLDLLESDDLSVSDSSAQDRGRVRFLKQDHVHPDICYLFEKKEYDMNISDADKDLLKERIQKLVTLLGSSRASRQLRTLQAVGYVDDPQFHCWWIVFRFPMFLPSGEVLTDSEPLSLRRLFASPLKPSLEHRFALTRRLSSTFSKLYGSDWMHKSINSSNIIFPEVLNKAKPARSPHLSSALVQGFGYSRQHTEDQTIDRGRVLGDLESAIYRHPSYQGEAASGYQIHYDIYSFGLVLFEIATWAPLMDLLAAVPRQKPPVDLSPNMARFQETEALELKRRALIRVDYDLPFRVGSKYTAVVRWCLTLGEPVSAVEFYNCVAIPLGEILHEGLISVGLIGD